MRPLFLALALVACPKGGPGGGALESHVVAEGEPSSMHERLDHVTKARDLVIAGRIAEARAQLQWVAENEAPAMSPEAWRPWLEDLRDGAATGAEAQEIEPLAQAIAQTGLACGKCHRGTEAQIAFEAVPVPASDALMARHVWASDRMWEGLVVADPARWREAIDVLEGETEIARIYEGVPLREAAAAARLHQRTHQMAGAARDELEAEDIASLYGTFLAACAECHALLEGGP